MMSKECSCNNHLTCVEHSLPSIMSVVPIFLHTFLTSYCDTFCNQAPLVFKQMKVLLEHYKKMTVADREERERKRRAAKKMTKPWSSILVRLGSWYVPCLLTVMCTCLWCCLFVAIFVYDVVCYHVCPNQDPVHSSKLSLTSPK